MTHFCLGTAALGTATPHCREVIGTRVGCSGNTDREVLRIAVIGVVGPEGQRGTIDNVIPLRSNQVAVGVEGTHIVHEGVAHGKASTTVGMSGVVVAAEVVVAVDP